MRHVTAIIRVITVSALLLNVAQAADKTDKAMKLANDWQDKTGTAIRGPDGRILFVYGESQPRIVCGLFMICDIAMERGEFIDTVRIGDSTRWQLSPARVGEGDSMVDHILIKPEEAGLRTNLFVATDRRSYMMELVSTESETMGQIGFLYGNSQWTTPVNTTSGTRENSIAFNTPTTPPNGDMALLPRPLETPGPTQIVTVDPTPVGDSVMGEELNFTYFISTSDVAWRPIRVYDDGRKTFIDLDKRKVGPRDLPVFLVNDTISVGEMVVYRYDSARSRFIVDGLFDHGILILGKGRKAQKVTIKRHQLDQAASRW